MSNYQSIKTEVVEQDQLECGRLLRRTISVSNNCSHDFCERNYRLYFPSCEEKDFTGSEILPLVFTIHCLGCTWKTMSHWVPIAEKYRFVLVIPEGVRSSFNAPQSACCGHARAMEVDDVGFLQSIITELASSSLTSNRNTSLPMVLQDLVYGMGWSNGGYLVMAAAKLFRAIAPISGFQVSNELLPTNDRPTALFMHQAEDDEFVRITGCCEDQNMPACCCSLSTGEEKCTSASQKFEAFGNLVNHCSNDEKDNLIVTHQYGDGNSVICTSLSNCKANTTFCRHNRGGHFNKPNFEKGFIMTSSIADFFANDACTFYGGQWNSSEKCHCLHSLPVGAYCSVASGEAKHGVESKTSLDKTSLSSHAVPPDAFLGSTMKFSLLLFCVCSLMVVLRRYYNNRLRYTGFQKVSTNTMIELRKI